MLLVLAPYSPQLEASFIFSGCNPGVLLERPCEVRLVSKTYLGCHLREWLALQDGRFRLGDTDTYLVVVRCQAFGFGEDVEEVKPAQLGEEGQLGKRYLVAIMSAQVILYETYGPMLML